MSYWVDFNPMVVMLAFENPSKEKKGASHQQDKRRAFFKRARKRMREDLYMLIFH